MSGTSTKPVNNGNEGITYEPAALYGEPQGRPAYKVDPARQQKASSPAAPASTGLTNNCWTTTEDEDSKTLEQQKYKRDPARQGPGQNATAAAASGLTLLLDP
ncbi:hypothetical protein ACP70R_018077 [Stipagrostis hirtigluma subsp. patula]